MRIAYFDCFSGASGDMILGALIANGWPSAELEAAIDSLGIGQHHTSVRTVPKQGIAATAVSFSFPNQPPTRRLGDLIEMIQASGLPQSLKQTSVKILERLGEAERRVHNLATPLADIHLHELGSLDTVCDVVGAVSGLAALGIEAVYVSPLALGSGMIKTAHGIFPVPAPAVAELVRGCPVLSLPETEGELLTPTGASILTTIASGFGSMPSMMVRQVGYGAGSVDRSIPNVLRLWIGDTAVASEEADEVVAIEMNLDDFTPELSAALVERLLSIGALDAYITPTIMKKGRPGVIIGVLCKPDDFPQIQEVIFNESSTLGVRYHTVSRLKLARDVVSLPTEYGAIRVKLGKRAGKVVNVAPEFEDCRSAAEANHVPVKTVYEAARLAFQLRSQD